MSLIKHWAKLVNESTEENKPVDTTLVLEAEDKNNIIQLAKTWFSVNPADEDYDAEIDQMSTASIEIKTSDSTFIFKNKSGKDTFNPQHSLYSFLTSDDQWYYNANIDGASAYGVGILISFLTNESEEAKQLSTNLEELFQDLSNIAINPEDEHSIKYVLHLIKRSNLIIGDDMSITYDGSPFIKLIPEHPMNK